MTRDTERSTFDLAPHRWRHRLLLLFAPGAGDARYREQLERLRPRGADLADREMRVVHLLAAAPPAAGTGASGRDDEVGTPGDAARLRERFGDAGGEGFGVVLVGKDGGAKERWSDPVDPDEVFALVDAMPMRRREMRERGG